MPPLLRGTALLLLLSSMVFADAGEKVTVRFSGLTAETTASADDGAEVCSPEIPSPDAIRYAWGNNPTCNLYSKDGLPAAPFRIALP